MVLSVNRAASAPDSARFGKCSEPFPPYGPIFRRPQKDADNASAKVSSPEGASAQQKAWNHCMRSAKRAWQSWQRMPVGCYPIKPPYFTGARTETGIPPDTRAAIWNGKKDADGSIHICSLAFPNASPQLVIAPGRTPLHSLVVTLDGKALSGASSVQELQMANLLAETLDHAV